MTKYERHPAPEKLLRQITAEAVNILGLGGEDRFHEAAPLEAGVGLIVKAWGLPQESWQASIDLIEKEKEFIRSGSSECVLPSSEVLESYDGPMIAELIWGLFATAVKLEDVQDRVVAHHLALWLAEALNFDEWIEKCGPDEEEN